MRQAPGPQRTHRVSEAHSWAHAESLRHAPGPQRTRRVSEEKGRSQKVMLTAQWVESMAVAGVSVGHTHPSRSELGSRPLVAFADGHSLAGYGQQLPTYTLVKGKITPLGPIHQHKSQTLPHTHLPQTTLLVNKPRAEILNHSQKGNLRRQQGQRARKVHPHQDVRYRSPGVGSQHGCCAAPPTRNVSMPP